MDMGCISIKKVPQAPGSKSKVRGETIVVFATVEIRDAVKRAAKELAGDPDAGVRLEVPFHMQGSLKALESVSYNLKKKKPNMRRNIKFDDATMSLVLDFNTDPLAVGSVWRRVTPEQALQMKGKFGSQGQTSDISNKELEDLLDS